jgi:hypothetical protein
MRQVINSQGMQAGNGEFLILIVQQAAPLPGEDTVMPPAYV